MIDRVEIAQEFAAKPISANPARKVTRDVSVPRALVNGFARIRTKRTLHRYAAGLIGVLEFGCDKLRRGFSLFDPRFQGTDDIVFRIARYRGLIFSADVVRICREALEGKFPEKKS